MLRWFLVLALFCLAGLILYYQSSQRSDAQKAAYQTGYVKGSDEQRPQVLAADSLRDSLAKLESEKRQRDTAYRQLLAVNDSLEALANSQSTKINDLSKSVRLAASTPKGAGKPAIVKPVTSHSQALAYYKKRYESLPGDLTSYERQVAVREIRLETANKFSMSLGEFEKLRTAGKLP